MKTRINKIGWVIITVICIILCSSCKTKYIPVESIKTEYIVKNNIDSFILRDSIHIHDSINTIIKGDTIEKTIYKNILQYKYKDKIILKCDTIVKIDSIDRPVVIKEIQYNHSLYWWQKLFIVLGVGVFIYIIYNIIKYFKKQ